LLEERESQLTLARETEQGGLGLTFEHVDESIAPLRGRMTPLGCAGLAVTSFCAFLAIASVVVGAFDRRILAAADVVASGFPLLGTLKAS
jgi:hypothetical protein